jgi:hypothetical protein
MAPAIVGKPMAAARDLQTKRKLAPFAQSAAILSCLAVGILFVPIAFLSHGLVRLALIGAAIGVPATMIIESTYWRMVFIRGPRGAGIALSVSYSLQAIFLFISTYWLSPNALVVAPFVALAIPAAVELIVVHDVAYKRALVWIRDYRKLWVPYVIGVSAGVAMTLAIPTVLSATAGFSAASIYRAAELAFGGSNLLLGVAGQSLLTQETERPRTTYLRVSAGLGLITGLNGLAIEVVPRAWLTAVIGSAAHLLLSVLIIVTVQRIALAFATVSGNLLIARVPPRIVGAMDITVAAFSMSGLVVGGILSGPRGALTGLAIAEVLSALLYARIFRKATR